MPGGFVGVDVFFVISGFLISSLLYREFDTTGRLDVARFYARRVRRLMPAAVVTIIVTVIASWFLVRTLRRITILTDAAWTGAYLANYHFAQGQVGYFGNDTPSPLVHFWSLAVEEQFYVVWPVLLLLTFVLGRGRRAALAALLAIVLGLSLWASIRLTREGSLNAYYSLGTRAWELAIGAATALLVRSSRRGPGPATATVAAVAGLGLVAWSALRLSEDSSFPGWVAAVPTVGTAMVIWAGSHRRGLPVERAMAPRPIRYFGDISYSLYLWHWPVIVLLATRYAGGQPPAVARIAAAAGAVVLGGLSYAFIEQPTARWRTDRRAGVVVASGLTVSALVVVGSLAVAAQIPTSSSVIVTPTATGHTTVRLVDGQVLVDPSGPAQVPPAIPANVRPKLVDLQNDLAEVFTRGCFDAKPLVCEGGDPVGTKTILLLGDSQIGHWWPAFDLAGKERHWRIRVIGLNGCPLGEIDVRRPRCLPWRGAALVAARETHPDLLVFANHAQGYRALLVGGPASLGTLWAPAVADALASVHAPRVLYLGQFPQQQQVPATCLADHPLDPGACATSIGDSVLADVAAAQRQAARRSGAWYLDPRDLVCTQRDCPVVVEDVIGYRDASHLTRTYARSLTPQIAEITATLLAVPPGAAPFRG